MLVALVDVNGEMDRRVDGTRWTLPTGIQLRDDRIYYDPHPSSKTVVHSDGMFEAFYKLADAPPDSILKFARKYGVLWLCEKHDLPSSHNAIKEGPDCCLPLGDIRANQVSPSRRGGYSRVRHL